MHPALVIDTHAHIVPPSLLTELASMASSATGFRARRTGKGWIVDVPGVGETRPAGPRMTDIPARRDWLAATGVTRQVLSPWMDIQAGHGTGRDWAARLNDAMCESAVELGGGTVALATVDTTDPELAAADLVKATETAELAGVMLNTDPLTGPPLHDPRLTPLWTAAAERRVPVVLHPPTAGPSGQLGLAGLGNVHGRLIDTTVAVTRLILHGVLDRHPDLRLIVVHGGGFLPYQASRLDGGYRSGESSVGDLARGKPSAYLSELYYDTVALSADSIRFLAGLAAPGHVLLGSDYPFPIGDPQPVQTVREAGLADETVESVLHGTATELFGGTA